MKSCVLCERKCRVNRFESSGYCGVKEARISSEFAHVGEEPELIPSHTFFFSGCTFKCVFCQNWDISQYPENGAKVSVNEVVSAIKFRKRTERTKNVNWVGGDPTPNLLFILRVLKNLDINIPQIWNSNMYCSEECMCLLDGVVDLYLTDFKYWDNKCAEKYSDAKNYREVVCRNHLIARKQAEMIIRHLVMPNHVECCTKPILRWISKNLNGIGVRVNLMDQYRPEYKAFDYPEISRRLTNDEWREALDYAKSLKLSLTD